LIYTEAIAIAKSHNKWYRHPNKKRKNQEVATVKELGYSLSRAFLPGFKISPSGQVARNEIIGTVLLITFIITYSFKISIFFIILTKRLKKSPHEEDSSYISKLNGYRFYASQMIRFTADYFKGTVDLFQ
jgi:hypothetical protein